IFDSVVALGADFPFPLEGKAGVLFLRDERAAALAAEVNRLVGFRGPSPGRFFVVGVGEIGERQGLRLSGERERGESQERKEGARNHGDAGEWMVSTSSAW